MTEQRARDIAADRGWTLAHVDGLWHVLDGGLPIGAGVTIQQAVESAVDRLAP